MEAACTLDLIKLFYILVHVYILGFFFKDFFLTCISLVLFENCCLTSALFLDMNIANSNIYVTLYKSEGK